MRPRSRQEPRDPRRLLCQAVRVSGEQDSCEVDVPLLLGRGTSNETWTAPHTDEVQRRPIGENNALDLRVINDTDARAVLRDARLRLPTAQQLARGIASSYDDRSSRVLAHGDPTVGNFMWTLGEPVLTDWELARPAPEVSAAAHTHAALVTRARYPLRPRRMEEFVERVAGAREAVKSGLYATYYGYEVARAPWVDVLRGLRGEVDPDLVHRNVARFLGDNAPSRRQVGALLRTHARGDFPVPMLPRTAVEHLASRTGPEAVARPDRIARVIRPRQGTWASMWARWVARISSNAARRSAPRGRMSRA